MRRRPLPAFAAPAAEPDVHMNTTPLIDVMLVLLVMFIVTVPIATHKVAIDLPQGGVTSEEPRVHRLDLDAAGRLLWNGVAVAPAALPARLAEVLPDDELHLRADAETPYDRVDHTLAAIKRAGVTRLGLIDNQRFGSF